MDILSPFLQVLNLGIREKIADNQITLLFEEADFVHGHHDGFGEIARQDLNEVRNEKPRPSETTKSSERGGEIKQAS